MEHLSDEAVAWQNELQKESLDTGKAWGLKEIVCVVPEIKGQGLRKS
jgi:hypothetical protein